MKFYQIHPPVGFFRALRDGAWRMRSGQSAPGWRRIESLAGRKHG